MRRDRYAVVRRSMTGLKLVGGPTKAVRQALNRRTVVSGRSGSEPVVIRRSEL
jgi:hypothetical protein